MTRLVNDAYDHMVFTMLGWPEWNVGEVRDVPEDRAIELLSRSDNAFSLAAGETDPRAQNAPEPEQPARRRGAAPDTEPAAEASADAAPKE